MRESKEVTIFFSGKAMRIPKYLSKADLYDRLSIWPVKYDLWLEAKPEDLHIAFNEERITLKHGLKFYIANKEINNT